MDSPRLTITLVHRLNWLLKKTFRLSVDYWGCDGALEIDCIDSALKDAWRRYSSGFDIATQEDLEVVDCIYFRLNEIETQLVSDFGDVDDGNF